MVQISINYQGELRCLANHGPSGTSLSTDAPIDNNGLGQSFSPTDLVATALGSCMATVMGIIAQRKDLDLSSLSIKVRKHMSDDSPRRISKLEVDLEMPIAENHPEAKVLKAAANGCPVHHSLDPRIETIFTWKWASS